MKRVVICGGNRELAELLRRKLGNAASVFSADVFRHGSADAAVLCDGAETNVRSPFSCRVLILPGGASAGPIRADSVITYGWNGKDTVTLSSVGDGKCILALQRAVVTTDGTLVESQEISLRTAGFPSGEVLMACSAAMLALGVPPGALGRSAQ